MRIIYVNDSIAIWGGLERIVVEKANLLSLMNYDVYLVTLNQGEHPIPYQLNPSVKYSDLNIQFHKQYQYHGLKRLLMMLKLNREYKKRIDSIIRKINPDIIICVRPELLSAIAEVKGNIPLVFESHASRYAQRFLGSDYYSRLKNSFYNRNAKFAQVVVALTEGDAHDWRSINPNVCVIPNVVNLNKTGCYSSCQSKSILFVGRFSRQKDVSILLKIWSIVYQRHSDWQLQLYGAYGEEQDALLPLINQNNENIIYHAPTKNIYETYCESSILLLTSRFEPFGLVIPEAMSCGLPVVAFDCPYGPASIISNGKDGFLVKNRDVVEFADKVCMLIENAEMRRSMGLLGIQSSKRFDSSIIMPLWDHLFKQYDKDTLN